MHRHMSRLLAAAVLFTVPLSGMAQDISAPTVSEEIGPDVFIVSSWRANMLVRIGATGSFIAGPQYPELVRGARALMADRKAPPVRFVLAAAADDVAMYGDGGWGRRGAITFAHEALRYRMPLAPGDSSANPFQGIQTGLGFSEVVQIALGGDEAHLVHQQSGYSDADVLVHLEQSKVVYLGTLLTTDGYPAISLDNGGSINGLIDAVGVFVDHFSRDSAIRYVPLRGHVTDNAGLRAYRDMLVAIRDRVQAQLDSGRTEDEVIASRVTRDLDARWGHGPLPPARFRTLVYRSLRKH